MRTDGNNEIYQDVLGPNGVEVKGVRDCCAARYEAILKQLSYYRRRFTMLDFGAAQGYFSIRAARETDCVAVMCDSDHRLKRIVSQSNTPRLIVLERRFSVEDVERLAEVERVDVVLALNVLHHFDEWERVLNDFLRMSDQVIVETPHWNDEGACGQERLAGIFDRVRNAKRIGEFASHTSPHERIMVVLDGTPTRQTRPFLGEDQNQCDIERAALRQNCCAINHKKSGDDKVQPWVQGINLQTYLKLGGVWPPRNLISQWVSDFPLPAEHHGDVRPWNFILDGEAVYLIDGHDDRANFDDEEGRQETLRLIQQADTSPVYLNIGSGQRPFGHLWENIDVNPKWNPDIVADGTSLPMFSGDSTNLIMLHHVIEHFDPAERDKLLAECYRLLKPGGSVIVIAPDMWALTERWKDGRMNDQLFQAAVYGAYMGHEGDRHKQAYTPQTLKAVLGKWFKDVRPFDWRKLEGADVAARDWWFFGLEAVK